MIKPTDWKSFKLKLDEKINLSVPLRTKEQLDNAVELLVKDIQLVAREKTLVIN